MQVAQTADELSAEILLNAQGQSPYVLLCEHAGNVLPNAFGTLGLPLDDLERHIAWDIGAANVTVLLSKLMDASAVMQRYSRLAYDCNRPPHSPDAMPKVSETTVIPGNANLSPVDKILRTVNIYRPFHAAVAALLDVRACYDQPTIVVSIHSFTKTYKGKERAVELGLLFDRDPSLANQLAKSFPNIDVRLNEPYGPKDGVMHTLNLHAAARGLRHVMVEIRNDLIATERGQQEWAQRLSVALIQAAQHQGV
jgi:predicted N-formylglutamate amidohydrolase